MTTTTLITDDHLAAAGQAVIDARARIDRLRGRGLLTAEEAEGVTRAVGKERELIDHHAVQQTRLAERADLEREHATELKRLARDLAKTWDAAAVAVAGGHLTGIVDALAAHNAAVTAGHARLAELGMPAVDDVVEHETGWCSSMSTQSVLLSGRTWIAVPLDVVVVRLVGRALVPHIGRQHVTAWCSAYRAGSHASSSAQALIDQLDERAAQVAA